MKSVSLFFIIAVLFAAAVTGFPPNAARADSYRSTDLPLPRFVSVKADKAYARTGPGQNYPIRWVYRRENLPVEIFQEYGPWRKIRDIDGDEGWIHRSLLSGRRSVIVHSGDIMAALYSRPDERDSKIAALVNHGAIMLVDECAPQWCRVYNGKYKGWIERKFLWGIYGGENLN